MERALALETGATGVLERPDRVRSRQRAAGKCLGQPKGGRWWERARPTDASGFQQGEGVNFGRE